jgi:TusA-related sulfurtransferase
MSEKIINLIGKVCPYPIAEIIYEVDRMSDDAKLVFLVDDPLAIKAVPEELEEYEDEGISHEIEGRTGYWEIIISKTE